MTANKIDITDEACEEYFQEVLGFTDVTTSGSPTPSDDLIVSTTYPTLTPFGDSDFLLFEEANAFLEDLKGITTRSGVAYQGPTIPTSSKVDKQAHVQPLVTQSETPVSKPIAAPVADFVVVDFEPDPRVPLFLGRCFLKTGRALIDVHKGELTLRIGNEAITYNLDQTSRYSANYDQMRANKIDITDEACEEYFQEVLGFSDISDSPWVSPVHYVPKKGDFTIVKNEKNELIPTRLVTRWRVKNKQEKDKIETKPDQIEKKQEAWKSPAVSKTNHSQNIIKKKKIQSPGTKFDKP
nr:reverse transcriptase domain-containing protein [Tanacetum cinerariifolium]